MEMVMATYVIQGSEAAEGFSTLSDVVGSGGFRISFPDMENIVLATSLGDVNQDGYGDFMVSLPDAKGELCTFVQSSLSFNQGEMNQRRDDDSNSELSEAANCAL